MIYIASPYSDPDHIVMEDRAHMVSIFAVHCAKQGHVIYCPISSWHHLAVKHGMPKSFVFWQKLDIGILRHCDELWVLKLDGWEKSRGVREEITAAVNLDIKIRYFYWENYKDAI